MFKAVLCITKFQFVTVTVTFLGNEMKQKKDAVPTVRGDVSLQKSVSMKDILTGFSGFLFFMLILLILSKIGVKETQNRPREFPRQKDFVFVETCASFHDRKIFPSGKVTVTVTIWNLVVNDISVHKYVRAHTRGAEKYT